MYATAKLDQLRNAMAAAWSHRQDSVLSGHGMLPAAPVGATEAEIEAMIAANLQALREQRRRVEFLAGRLGAGCLATMARVVLAGLVELSGDDRVDTDGLYAVIAELDRIEDSIVEYEP
jgi:hypothetical protein